MEAIGVFDSGVGGLTVVRSIRRLMPNENIVYIGDTARLPYGNKSEKSIIEFSISNVNFLLEKRVKCIVVACNTASAAALGELTRRYSIPIIGVIEAGAKKAVAEAQKDTIGVIGTYRTVKSTAYDKAINSLKSDIKVLSKACPLFVPIIEESFEKHPATSLIIKEYLNEISEKTDTIILGCTHYPLIKQEISAIYPNIKLIDSADAVAESVKNLLHEKDMLSTKGGRYEYYATDVSENFVNMARRILSDNTLEIKEFHT